jgi:hypothetical protein
MLPIHREVKVLIPEELVDFVEVEMQLSLLDTCNKVLLDILKGWKEAKNAKKD